MTPLTPSLSYRTRRDWDRLDSWESSQVLQFVKDYRVRIGSSSKTWHSKTWRIRRALLHVNFALAKATKGECFDRELVQLCLCDPAMRLRTDAATGCEDLLKRLDSDSEARTIADRIASYLLQSFGHERHAVENLVSVPLVVKYSGALLFFEHCSVHLSDENNESFVKWAINLARNDSPVRLTAVRCLLRLCKTGESRGDTCRLRAPTATLREMNEVLDGCGSSRSTLIDESDLFDDVEPTGCGEFAKP